MLGSSIWFSVFMVPVCHTLSNAISTSMNMAGEKFFIFLACVVVCVSCNILSLVNLSALKPACSSFILLFCSAQFVNLLLIIDSNIFHDILCK